VTSQLGAKVCMFGSGVRRPLTSNFTFNHIGHFAAAGHAVAKALFLGGVTRRSLTYASRSSKAAAAGAASCSAT
jgi:hypothetical protein